MPLFASSIETTAISPFEEVTGWIKVHGFWSAFVAVCLVLPPNQFYSNGRGKFSNNLVNIMRLFKSAFTLIVQGRPSREISLPLII